MAEIKPGAAVVVRDMMGQAFTRRAMSGVETKGHDFAVVWVCRPEEWEAAQREGREADCVPWPADDVTEMAREPHR